MFLLVLALFIYLIGVKGAYNESFGQSQLFEEGE